MVEAHHGGREVKSSIAHWELVEVGCNGGYSLSKGSLCGRLGHRERCVDGDHCAVRVPAAQPQSGLSLPAPDVNDLWGCGRGQCAVREPEDDLADVAACGLGREEGAASLAGAFFCDVQVPR